MATPNFRDAIQNINNKLAAAAQTATAEELAYLGSAIEKIAGKASALDLLNETEAHIEAITALASSITDDLNALKTTYNDQHTAALSNLTVEADSISSSALSELQASVNTAISAIQTAVRDTGYVATHAQLYFYTKS